MGGGTQCTQSMCRYHGGVLSQYVHIGYITQALYCRIIRIAFVADLLNVFTCRAFNVYCGEENCLTILHHNIKCADATGNIGLVHIGLKPLRGTYTCFVYIVCLPPSWSCLSTFNP